MSDGQYAIVFSGEILEGFDSEDVKATFARLFKLSEEKLEQIFAHPKVVLSKNLSAEQASRYQQVLEKAGVRTHLQPPLSAPAAAEVTAAESADFNPEATMVVGAAREASDEIPQVQASSEIRQLPFSFTGKGTEYFKIWIVNIVLTILTLGIYSAWAKVRNKQYFYGNTRLDGASFEYTAKPITILKGRLIAFALFVVYSLLNNFIPALGALLGLMFAVAFPWLAVRSLAFNAYNSAYRNVRFGFKGPMKEAIMVFLFWPSVGLLSLGLLMPLVMYKQHRFMIENSRYGTSEFSFTTGPGGYFRIMFMVIGIAIVGSLLVAGLGMLSPFLSPIAAIPLYLIIIAYATVEITNLRFNATSLDMHGFEANYELKSFALLFAGNLLGMLLTLGLFYPWAKVRLARYKAEHIGFVAHGDLEGFSAAEASKVSAIGQEVGDVFDMEIGL